MLRWLIVAIVAVSVPLSAVSVPLSAAHPFQKAAPQPNCGYATCAPVVPDKLNVHMIPHTHDDVGWLSTVDQYYENSVRYILDSAVKALQDNPERRFTYAEMAYFVKWWLDQPEDIQAQVRGLVNSGQLEIINGAWAENDEAASHYQSIIDQYSWGLRFLNDTFGDCGRPKAAWLIDSFGHSRQVASILAQMGYNGLFFARLDYQDREKRLADKTAEMIWRGSPDNLGESSDLFTHAFQVHYSPPPGFCFECGDEPLNDDTSSPDYNIPDRVKAFVDHVKAKSTQYRSNNVLVTMGDDFTYRDANVWYTNMDKLAKYVTADNASNVNVIYSTPSCYLKAVNDAGLEWPEKTDDFFPYGGDDQTYWTGYFTSKPSFKYFERLGNNFLQVSKQLLALAGSTDDDLLNLKSLREAMGVVQHHDAITGTMKDFVAQDYALQLDSAIAKTGIPVEAAVNKLIGNNGPTLVPIISCLKLNVSECASSEVADNFVVTIYNPLSRPISQYIRLPVTSTDSQVQHPNGSVIPSDRFPIPDAVLRVPGRNSAATTELVFRAENVPPLGLQSFYVTQSFSPNGETAEADTPTETPTVRAFTIGNDVFEMSFDDSGALKSITTSGITVNVTQTFEYYIGADSSGQRNSGAYIFRPNGPSTVSIGLTKFTVAQKTPRVQEVYQEFGGGWVSQVIRVYAEENHAEFEWMVGPIPEDNQQGKEVISKFTTDLATDGTFYTDTNSREVLKRVRDFRPTWDLDVSEPISSNYYPVTSKLLIRDEAKGVEVAVLVDRAQGGSSIKDGEIELMLHRRLYHDDGFGVGEALNEQQFGTGLVARGTQWLIAGPLGSKSYSTAQQERQLQANKLLKLWTFFSPTNGLKQPDWVAAYNGEYSALTGSGLPFNVNLLSLEPWTQDNTLLLRLEHFLEVNEDDELSKPATVDLSTAFAHFKINSAVETTLAGNQLLEDLNRLQWKSEVKRSPTTKENKALDITAITLNPMEIRTFIVNYTRL